MPTLDGVAIPDANESQCPLVATAVTEGRLHEWALQHQEWMAEGLHAHGALLFRGFCIDGVADFRRLSDTLCGPLLEYAYRSTPRTSVGDRVYTATDYSPRYSIPLHNENSYLRDWPMKLAFYCEQPAAAGGQTVLALTAKVTSRIPRSVRDAFNRRGVMYVRNYGQNDDLSWEATFQTTSRADVEAWCRDASLEWQWLPDGRLRTRQVCPAMATHPHTGDDLWFNQAHVLHPSSLGREKYMVMLETFGESNLPRNVCFGDEAPIDGQMLDLIRAAYAAELRMFDWSRRDVLLIDNMLAAHGRAPFKGERKVFVVMGDAYSHQVPSAGGA